MLRFATVRVLSIVEIHHLEIAEPVGMSSVITLVNLLPELETLRFHSLLFDESRTLNADKSSIQIKDANKIKKLCINTINDFDQLDFLLNNFLYIIFIKIDYIDHMDIESFIRNMFIKINWKDSYNRLRSLCCYVPEADDETIKKLKDMINNEKLSFHYTVHRVLQYIYLIWEK